MKISLFPIALLVVTTASLCQTNNLTLQKLAPHHAHSKIKRILMASRAQKKNPFTAIANFFSRVFKGNSFAEGISPSESIRALCAPSRLKKNPFKVGTDDLNEQLFRTARQELTIFTENAPLSEKYLTSELLTLCHELATQPEAGSWFKEYATDAITHIIALENSNLSSAEKRSQLITIVDRASGRIAANPHNNTVKSNLFMSLLFRIAESYIRTPLQNVVLGLKISGALIGLVTTLLCIAYAPRILTLFQKNESEKSDFKTLDKETKADIERSASNLLLLTQGLPEEMKYVHALQTYIQSDLTQNKISENIHAMLEEKEKNVRTILRGELAHMINAQRELISFTDALKENHPSFIDVNTQLCDKKKQIEQTQILLNRPPQTTQYAKVADALQHLREHRATTFKEIKNEIIRSIHQALADIINAQKGLLDFTNTLKENYRSLKNLNTRLCNKTKQAEQIRDLLNQPLKKIEWKKLASELNRLHSNVISPLELLSSDNRESLKNFVKTKLFTKIQSSYKNNSKLASEATKLSLRIRPLLDLIESTDHNRDLSLKIMKEILSLKNDIDALSEKSSREAAPEDHPGPGAGASAALRK